MAGSKAKTFLKKYLWIAYIFITVTLLILAYVDIKNIEKEKEGSGIEFEYEEVTPIANLTCIECHSDMAGEDPTIPSDEWWESHSNYDMYCSDCHGGDLDSPLTPNWNATHPPASISCSPCHGDDVQYTMSGADWFSSTHKEAGTTCADCHGGDPTNETGAMSGNFIGMPDDANISRICGSCHFDVYKEYSESIHNAYILDENGTTTVANTCTDCHGIHHIESHNNPESPVYTLNSPNTCAKCHETKYYSYTDSYHGSYLLLGGEIVATCSDCHGIHAIRPVSDPDSIVHPNNVAETCAVCHNNTDDADMSEGKVHYEGEYSEDVYFIFGLDLRVLIPTIYKIATVAMISGLIALMFLENYGWGKKVGEVIRKWQSRKK